MTLLRCLTGHKYPLGASHTSLQHLADKATDSVLSIPHKDFQRTLASLLDLDGDTRIANFKALPADIDQYPYHASVSVPVEEREFKNTTFLPSAPKHVLELPLLSPGSMSPVAPTNGYNGHASGLVSSSSRSQSRDRLAAHFAAGLELVDDDDGPLDKPGLAWSPRGPHGIASTDLLLLNPTREPAIRAISFVKYALRCAGILYHVQPLPTRSCEEPSHQDELQADLAQDLPQIGAPRTKAHAPVLHCVHTLPKEVLHPHSAAASQLLNLKLRPNLSRAQTAAASTGRSPSAPPASSTKSKKATSAGSKSAKVRCLEFWIQILPVYVRGSLSDSKGSSSKLDRRARSRSRTRNGEEGRKCTKLRICVSDEAALPYIRKALDMSELEADATKEGGGPPMKHVSGPDRMEGKGRKKVAVLADPEEEHARGRPKLSRSASSGEQEMAARRRAPLADRPAPKPGRPQLSRAFTEAPVFAESTLDRVRQERSPISDPDSLQSPVSALASLAPLLPVPSRSKSSRGFFDLVGFARPRDTAAPYTAANTPAPVDESSPASTRPSTPGHLLFAAAL